MLAPIRTISGRSLVLVHLRAAKRDNLEMCSKLWRLRHPELFDKRLSLVEEGSRLPERCDFEIGDNRHFSWSGKIDDATLPPKFRTMPMAEPYFMPANQYGYAQPGDQQFVLGGGNIDYCLWETFASLVKIKLGQNEPLQAIIPLAMVYQPTRSGSPIEYIEKPNQYAQYLERKAKSFRVTINDVPVLERPGGGPLVELNWFTSLRDMWLSPLFPETNSPDLIRRLIAYFGK